MAGMLDVPGNRKIAYALKHANAFLHLSRLGVEAYFRGDTEAWQAVLPNMAFATELYLKVLRAVRGGGQWPQGHDLKQLFDHLSAEDRTELERRYEGIRGSGPKEVLDRLLPGRDLSLPGVLEESRNAFPRLRYAFEGVEDPTAAPPPDAFGLLWFVSVLKPYIEEQDAPR